LSALWQSATATRDKPMKILTALITLLEPNDPVGDYKVKAKVSDLNAQTSFELETKLRLH